MPIDVQMSIAMYDDDLQKAIEPGAPTTQARLDTVRALADAGFPVTVFLMPIMPHMTDSLAAIDSALVRIKEAGGARRHLRSPAPASGSEAVVLRVARRGAARPGVVLPRAVPGSVGRGPEGVPTVARQAHPSADPHARPRRPPRDDYSAAGSARGRATCRRRCRPPRPCASRPAHDPRRHPRSRCSSDPTVSAYPQPRRLGDHGDRFHSPHIRGAAR